MSAPRTVYLHTHGHHPTLTHLDGRPVPEGARITRDTFDIGPAQRVDLALRTGSDGVHAVGPRRLADARSRAARRLQQGHQSGRRPHRDRLRRLHGRRRPADDPTDHPGHSAHARYLRSRLLPGRGAGVRSEAFSARPPTPTSTAGRRRRRPAGRSTIRSARQAAGAAAARPDRRRAPPPGGERLRGAAALRPAASS